MKLTAICHNRSKVSRITCGYSDKNSKALDIKLRPKENLQNVYTIMEISEKQEIFIKIFRFRFKLLRFQREIAK